MPLQIVEYLGALLVISLTKAIPLKTGRLISEALGVLIYYLLGSRRRIALDNLRHAYHDTKSERDLRRIARKSCSSFVVSLFETIKLRALLDRPAGLERLRNATERFSPLLRKAREIHERSGGCLFVTPHLGTWEFLPFIGLVAGIPLAVVVRPLDNRYLERLLYAHRATSGQNIVPKTNSLLFLQRTLRRGTSIGLLPDQRTIRAISVEYFGRPAMTTPAPALLAYLYNRPVVVVACCRRSGDSQHDGFVSDPIWPDPDQSEKTEVFRLTLEMNRTMEAIIRGHPEQYFWMHDRWKPFRTNKELFLQ